jgi:hypothetical protein
MNTRHKKGVKAIAIFVAFALAQISLQLSLAAPNTPRYAALLPQGLLAKVTSKGGQAITINGISSPSGSSVATNAIVETPAGVEATIDLGPLGSIDLAPGTKVKIEYECPPEKQNDPNPEECKVKVTVFAGCIVSTYKKGSRHQVDTDTQQNVAQSDKEKEKAGGGAIPFCKDTPIAGALATAAGLPWPGIAALIAAAIVVPTALVVVFDEGTTPSGAVP